MAWARRDSVVYLVHAAGPPRDEDWGEFIRDCQSDSAIRALVVSVGDSRPTPTQRGDIQKWFKEGDVRAAVLTDSVIARGAITAMRWFDLPVKGFATDREADAFEYAGIDSAHFEVARSVIRQLQRAMGEQPR